MKSKLLIRLAAVLITLILPCPVHADDVITPGVEWLDTQSRPINAHGGGVMFHNGVYYWYGEYKGDFTYRSPGVGWDCYRTEAGGDDHAEYEQRTVSVNRHLAPPSPCLQGSL